MPAGTVVARRLPAGRSDASRCTTTNSATYDTGDTFDQSLAKGFIQLWGLPSKIAAIRDRRVGSPVPT